MNKLIPFFAIIMVIIFSISIRNSYLLLNGRHTQVHTTDTTENFDPALKQDPGFEETEKRISLMISTERKKEDNAKTWIIVLNLLTTIITGVVALITTISTAKNKGLSFKATVAVAILTFTSTIISAVQGQVNTSKERITGKIAAIKKIRDKLEALKPSELPAQLPIINRELDEL